MNRSFGAVGRATRNGLASVSAIRLSGCLWELMVGFTVVLVLVTATGLLGPLHFENPSLRGAIEIAVTMWALAAAVLLHGTFKRTRSRRDMLLMVALGVAALSDFLFSAIPALADSAVLAGGPGVRLASGALVAVAFAAAARAGDGQVRGRGPAMVVTMTVAGVLVVAVGWLADIMATGSGSTTVREFGAGSASDHPIRLALMLVSSELLLLAGMAFLFRARRGFRDGFLLAAAAYLLSAARLQYLALPTTLVDSVTPRELIRLIAYALLLSVAARQYARTRRTEAQAAVAAERERLARDLHDGIAQDLAFIAVHTECRESGLGEDHPVTLAARRALAASRGAIVDLSASNAPNTLAALRGVADEIEGRFGASVNVRTELEETHPDGLAPEDREQVVRIAREAMLNAVRHGSATHLDVTLNANEELLLRVIDNGTGIGEGEGTNPNGFGLRTMRARADSLGGELIARRHPGGGTELTLVLR